MRLGPGTPGTGRLARLLASVPATAALALALLAPAPWAFGARAAETVVLTLRNHAFTPDAVTVPAGQRFRIEVVNTDDSVEEFESSDLKLEKIVVPGGRISLNVGPLKPGTYRFHGEYNPDRAHGTLTAVAPP